MIRECFWIVNTLRFTCLNSVFQRGKTTLEKLAVVSLKNGRHPKVPCTACIPFRCQRSWAVIGSWSNDDFYQTWYNLRYDDHYCYYFLIILDYSWLWLLLIIDYSWLFLIMIVINCWLLLIIIDYSWLWLIILDHDDIILGTYLQVFSGFFQGRGFPDYATKGWPRRLKSFCMETEQQRTTRGALLVGVQNGTMTDLESPKWFRVVHKYIITKASR